MLYVDDMIIASNNKIWMQDTKTALSKRFEMSDLGELKYFLGMEIKQNRNATTISLNQKKFENGTHW